jgi:glycosyltransferase involved in cell wall biosynthesis
MTSILSTEMSLPLVSIVTPTYNRRRFIPTLIRMIETQTYPRDRMEWIVYDDGQEAIGDLIDEAQHRLPLTIYIRSEEKQTLGEKRNRLNREAKGEILVAFDDDDFYAPAEDVPLMCPLISSGCCSTSMHFICNGNSTRMW